MTRALRRTAASAAASVLLLAFASSCGDDAGAELSDAGARGRSVANSNGCAACHGPDGQGGVGPTYVGLAGSERELIDGTVVIADDDYLVRSIKEPGAEIVAGFNLQMPRNSLSDEQIADVIAYIKDLSPEPADG